MIAFFPVFTSKSAWTGKLVVVFCGFAVCSLRFGAFRSSLPPPGTQWELAATYVLSGLSSAYSEHTLDDSYSTSDASE